MIVNIKEFGALGDGKTLNTAAIQKAIDTVAQTGGTVLIENGVYLTGTVIYKSNVEIRIEANATLLGSPDCNDYPEKELNHVITANLPRFRNASLIFAQECENISLTGMGKIDCNGETFIVEDHEDPRRKYRRDTSRPTPPRVVFFTGCKNIKVEDVTMVNQPAGWSYWIHDCDYVIFNKAKIMANLDYPNNDGIHINSSRNVTISNCFISCGDDGIIIRANNRSLKENKVCEKVTVTNCTITSYSAGIRFGWVNDGVIRNCAVSNVVFYDCACGVDFNLPYRVYDPDNPFASDVGVEATLIENISFNNIIMDKNYSTPVNIHADEHTEVKMNGIRNISFSNMRCRGPQFIFIMGKKENHVENISFNNCDFTLTDGSEFPNPVMHGSPRHYNDVNYHPMVIKYADNVTFNNTSFNT